PAATASSPTRRRPSASTSVTSPAASAGTSAGPRRRRGTRSASRAHPQRQTHRGRRVRGREGRRRQRRPPRPVPPRLPRAARRPRPEPPLGFSPTKFAGGAEPGEVGGVVWRDVKPAYYAAKVGPLTLDDKIEASGRLAVRAAASDSGATFGFFNADSLVN